MSEHAFHRDDSAGVPLACAINHPHTAAPDLLQNFIMTEAPFTVGHVRFCENAFERFTGRLAFGFESLAQETVDAGPVIDSGHGAALRAFRRMVGYIRNRIRWRAGFVHHAAAANAAHKCRISSSTSVGFSTV